MTIKTGGGLDLPQVKSIVAASLKNDWRGSSNPLAGGSRGGKIPGIVMIMIMNLVMSIFLGAIFIPVSDLFGGMVLAATGAMAVVAIQVLLEFGSNIVSPDDYHVIGPHPVNSRTFFAAKLAHLLIYVTGLSLTVSLAPAIFAAFAFDSLLAIPAVLGHFWLTNIFAAVVVMNLYTLILRKVDRRRLERLLGYIHLILMIGFYMGLNILPRVMRHALSGLDIATLPWTKALPSYWFAAWVKLVADGWDLETAALGLLGLTVILALGKLAVSYLSLGYSESLSRAAWVRSSSRKPLRTGIVGRFWQRVTSFEERALMLLVRANFKHDTQFRMNILGFIPLLLIYMVYGFLVAGSNVRDPFNPLPDTQVMTNVLLGLAMIILPYTMLSVMQSSKSWRASWIFHSTPHDRIAIIQAVDRIILRVLILPTGLLMLAMFTYLYKNLFHALLHTAFMIMVAVLGISFLNLFSIRLPFSMESRPGSTTGGFLRPMILAGLIFGIPVAIIANTGYGGYIGWAVCMVIAYTAYRLFGRGRVSRIRKFAADWEYTA